jgi:endonuclease/exonuclease/phosphatase family metal-dependent hydrolase
MSAKYFPDPDAINIKEGVDTLKVMSWNLWWKFENYLERQDLIFSEIKKLKPDIMCLQEVWEEEDESQAEKIASLLEYDHVYAKSFDFDGVAFGNAIISKYPIKDHTVSYMPAEPEFDEKRLLLHAEILYKEFNVDVMCTHLNYKYEHQHIREDQVQYIMEYISKIKKRKFPVILCGDFNADPNSDEIRLITGHKKSIGQTVLRDAWVITNPTDQGFTWSNKNSYAKKTLECDRRIDYIFVGKAGIKGIGHPLLSFLVGTEENNNVFPSDHFGIMTHLVG